MTTKVLHYADMAIPGWNIFDLKVDMLMNSCIRSSIGRMFELSLDDC